VTAASAHYTGGRLRNDVVATLELIATGDSGADLVRLPHRRAVLMLVGLEALRRAPEQGDPRVAKHLAEYGVRLLALATVGYDPLPVSGGGAV